MDKREEHAGTHQLYDTPMLQHKTPATSYERDKKRKNKDYVSAVAVSGEALAERFSFGFSCVSCRVNNVSVLKDVEQQTGHWTSKGRRPFEGGGGEEAVTSVRDAWTFPV